MGSDRSCWFWAYFFTIFLAFKKGRRLSAALLAIFFIKKGSGRLFSFSYSQNPTVLEDPPLGGSHVSTWLSSESPRSAHRTVEFRVDIIKA